MAFGNSKNLERNGEGTKKETRILLKNKNEERRKSHFSERNEEGTNASKKRNVQFLEIF